ncbi:hypothetical protein MLD38_000561 [Melastoma candidum]|uniref:Uncharacterized protein n=1 Tax=Melastoma candidum TaxID=119954 RepID=A0ACB9SAX8_9MYRT|nr:hypothetical protein MLD38_000561 [Melastoma candidum]
MNPPEGAETVRERTGSSLDVHAASRVGVLQMWDFCRESELCRDKATSMSLQASIRTTANTTEQSMLMALRMFQRWVSGVVGVVQTALWGAEPDEHPRPLVRRQAGITG